VPTTKTCPCPHCNAVGLLIPVAADVDYYRCYRCANVWTTRKDKPEPSDSVTVNFEVSDRRTNGECCYRSLLHAARDLPGFVHWASRHSP